MDFWQLQTVIHHQPSIVILTQSTVHYFMFLASIVNVTRSVHIFQLKCFDELKRFIAALNLTWLWECQYVSCGRLIHASRY